MDAMKTYRQRLIDTGEVELIVTDEETRVAVNAMVETVLCEYRDKYVIAQCRQNNDQHQRFIFADAEGQERIWNQPHPWHEELDIIDTIYLKLLEDAEEIAGDAEPLVEMIDTMHTRYYKALSERPHPDNPYVNMWMSGGPTHE